MIMDFKLSLWPDLWEKQKKVRETEEEDVRMKELAAQIKKEKEEFKSMWKSFGGKL